MVKTKNFGELAIDESKVITFDNGLIGFENLKKFIILKDENDPVDAFYWLQSVEDGDVAFPMVNILPILPDYDPLVEEEDVYSLGEESLENIKSYNITVIPEDVKEMSINLVAPIVINTKTLKGIQAIAKNDAYTTRFKVYDYLQNSEA